MSTATICDGCGQPIEPNTPFTAIGVWEVTFNEDGVRVNGVTTEYDYHADHVPEDLQGS